MNQIVDISSFEPIFDIRSEFVASFFVEIWKAASVLAEMSNTATGSAATVSMTNACIF